MLIYFDFWSFLAIISVVVKGCGLLDINFGFSSREELYKRVGPALKAKKAYLQKDGFSYISEIDIWNYLVQNKWSKSSNLMLCDIVDDILKADNKMIDSYLKKKLESVSRVQYFDKDLDIL